MKPLMPHLLLQLLVDPEAGEDGKILHTAQAGFAVKSFDPRLVHLPGGKHRPPDVIELRDHEIVRLSEKLLLILKVGRRFGGIRRSVILRVIDFGRVPRAFRVIVIYLSHRIRPHASYVPDDSKISSISCSDKISKGLDINPGINANLTPIFGGQFRIARIVTRNIDKLGLEAIGVARLRKQLFRAFRVIGMGLLDLFAYSTALRSFKPRNLDH